MDWVARKESITTQVKKLRYIILVALMGIFLMVFSEEETVIAADSTSVQVYQPDLQESLESILNQIAGAGEVRLLLSQAEGERILYQTDDSGADHNSRKNTVLVTDADRQETGLISQTLPPVYQGAVIVCQGGDSATVKLAIVQAVMSITGLSADRITVLKMK